ncbi:oxidoreductase family protein [Agarivorans litoreus]|uniref:oxidoreductase family protein n=1 Tax=Agarivorans litoreus TaxID=1510455 RepID=UPI001C7CA6F0|nr:oxidoreductase family protein [Agarivorans litoreus]
MFLTHQQQAKLKQLNSASCITQVDAIQSLWGGYGELLRVTFEHGVYPSLVVKNIRFPQQTKHPRGWNTARSHQRKVHSYQVELAWYQQFAQDCDQHCYVPQLIDSSQHNDQQSIILEDLHSLGYNQVKQHIALEQALVCVRWLAYFHARFMQRSAPTLWPQGGYWHLATRPDELTAMAESPLKQAASAIDQYLQSSNYTCLIHGDAKLANFCFNQALNRVAAVDFQYVGKGCGIQDLALFMGSCLSEQQCLEQQENILDYYFKMLRQALEHYAIADVNVIKLEQQWRDLYPFAWADFERFLEGWSPGHWKLTAYSEQQTQLALNILAKNTNE